MSDKSYWNLVGDYIAVMISGYAYSDYTFYKTGPDLWKNENGVAEEEIPHLTDD